jgi:hypothetical protein
VSCYDHAKVDRVFIVGTLIVIASVTVVTLPMIVDALYSIADALSK